MTKRARIRKLMRKHSIEKVVYFGPIRILGSDEWNKKCLDCDFYFPDHEQYGPDSSRAFQPSQIKNDLREIERLCYYIFDFKSGTINV